MSSWGEKKGRTKTNKKPNKQTTGSHPKNSVLPSLEKSNIIHEILLLSEVNPILPMDTSYLLP